MSYKRVLREPTEETLLRMSLSLKRHVREMAYREDVSMVSIFDRLLRRGLAAEEADKADDAKEVDFAAQS